MRNPEATSKTPLHASPHPKQHRPRSKASKGVNRQRICPLGNAANTYPSREELRAMRCRDVFDTFGRRHTTTTRRNYADCCAQTGSEPVPSQSVAGRGRWNAWLPLFPNTQAQRPTSFPKDASLRKPLLALPAERLAGRANGQRRTGTKTSERRRHTPHTQTHTTTLRHFREIRSRQRQTRYTVESGETALFFSTPPLHVQQLQSRTRHWHVFCVSYLHARPQPRGTEEREGEGRQEAAPLRWAVIPRAL